MKTDVRPLRDFVSCN